MTPAGPAAGCGRSGRPGCVPPCRPDECPHPAFQAVPPGSGAFWPPRRRARGNRGKKFKKDYNFLTKGYCNLVSKELQCSYSKAATPCWEIFFLLWDVGQAFLLRLFSFAAVLPATQAASRLRVQKSPLIASGLFCTLSAGRGSNTFSPFSYTT